MAIEQLDIKITTTEIYVEHEPLINAARMELLAWANRQPQPLQQAALIFLGRAGLGPKSYICTETPIGKPKVHWCMYFPGWIIKYLHQHGARLSAQATAKIYYQTLCGILQTFLTDSLIDADEFPTNEFSVIIALADLWQAEYINGWQSLFPATHPFWQHFQATHRLEWNSLLHEQKQHWDKVQPYGPTDIDNLSYRCAVGEVCIWALTYLGGQLELGPRLIEMMQLAQIGIQLWDDLSDWPVDLEKGNYSSYISRHFESGEKPTLNVLLQRNLRTRLLEETVEEALGYIRRAKVCLWPEPMTDLHYFLDSTSQRIEKTGQDEVAKRQELLREQGRLWLEALAVGSRR